MIKNFFGFLIDNFFYRKCFFIFFTSLSLMILCPIEMGGAYTLIFLFSLLLNIIVLVIISDERREIFISPFYTRRFFPLLVLHLINLALYVSLQIIYPSVLKDLVFSSNERITSLSNEELESVYNKIQNKKYHSIGLFGGVPTISSLTNNIKNEYNTRKEKESQ